MEFITDRGRHCRQTCERCGNPVWVPILEMQVNQSKVTCSDCQHDLRINPEKARREFDAAVRRSEQDSVAMRARWAAQDAARKTRTA